jgi:trehalose 6-phosphate phosphatase
MRELLAARNRAVIDTLAAREVLLGFDLDGTLAPIVDSPAKARLRPRTRALLAQAAARYPCAVITGRLRASAEELLEGTGVRWIVGNHGLEWPEDAGGGRSALERVEGWKRGLAPLRELRGVQLEDKRFTLSVHLRNAAEPRLARRRVRALAAKLPGCRVEPGIEVLNLIPSQAPDKGHAVRRLLELSGCTHAVYLGDDITDEAVFRMSSRRVLSVLVGTRTNTRASWRVRTQPEVDTLLELLVRARSARPGGRGAALEALGRQSKSR